VRLFARLDARWFQLVFLSSFLMFGAFARDFSLTIAQIALAFLAGLVTQAGWQFTLRLPLRFTIGAYLSALITCFGISILVRSENLWAHPLLAALAMSSKYLIRFGRAGRQRHLFNPANLAAFCAAYLIHGTWLSQGQWGSNSIFAIWLVALGGLVTGRIRRLDIGFSFLVVWAALLGSRLMVLDYAWDPGAAMWLQQVSNGALPLFAFFMISDPMTTPRRRIARITYAVLVALGAFAWQFIFFKGNGMIVSLFFCSGFVPLFDLLWPGEQFEWRHTRKLMAASHDLLQDVNPLVSEP
jgi:hypothetical protein